jgi:hypothetical protein
MSESTIVNLKIVLRVLNLAFIAMWIFCFYACRQWEHWKRDALRTMDQLSDANERLDRLTASIVDDASQPLAVSREAVAGEYGRWFRGRDGAMMVKFGSTWLCVNYITDILENEETRELTIGFGEKTNIILSPFESECFRAWLDDMTSPHVPANNSN